MTQSIVAKQTIVLSGLGELSNDDGVDQALQNDINRVAAENKVAFYPAYFDHELHGDAANIEKVTQELWGMSSDEWAENGFTATPVERKSDEYTNTWQMQIVANGEMNYYGRLTDEQIKMVVEFASNLVDNEAFKSV